MWGVFGNLPQLHPVFEKQWSNLALQTGRMEEKSGEKLDGLRNEEAMNQISATS